MVQVYESTPETQSPPAPEGRRAEVEVLDALRQALATGCSLLQFAEQRGVPESTVRHWVSRAQASGAPPAFTRFVESPEGLEVLHRISVAATFVLTQVVGGGVRAVCDFLELSGLWRVVAAGYGTQQAAVKCMEEAITAFDTEERAKLAASMAPRDISVAQDETFHEDPCLVAIEPVSNFILLEEYAKDRRAETWAAAMSRSLSDLPVKVIQSTSDEGSALLSVTRDSGAHHSPDLFHPQQDISRATSLPLQRKVDAAELAAREAAAEMDALLNEVEAYEGQPRGPGRPREYAPRLEGAEQKYKAAEAALEEARGRRQQVRGAARALSRAYHPFDLETGAARDASTVERDLQAQMNRIDRIANAVGLSTRCRALLDKARRVLPQMVATIAFVHTLIRHKVEALDLAPAVEDAVQRRLIPALYLDAVVPKAATAEARSALRATAASLRAAVDDPACALASLSTEERDQVHRVARECARLFQRSSSNVEGRNGILALRHHSLHELNPRKLKALTVVHNFWTRRPDGTTAAQRFFDQNHRDLFEFLLAKLPPPKRPAARRAAQP